MCVSGLVTHVMHRSQACTALLPFPARAALRWTGKRRYNIKLWKTFTDCFNCLPIAAIIDEKIFTMHGGLSPDLQSMEQIRRVMRPTDVPDTGACAVCSRCCHRRLTLGEQACCATCFGLTPTKTSPDGQRMTEECHLPSGQTSCRDSCRNTTWI